MTTFLSVDPLAADYAAWSPYNYVLGNPIMLIDPDGRAPGDPPVGGDPIQDLKQAWNEVSTQAFAAVAEVGSYLDKLYVKAKVAITNKLNPNIETTASVEVSLNLEGAATNYSVDNETGDVTFHESAVKVNAKVNFVEVKAPIKASGKAGNITVAVQGGAKVNAKAGENQGEANLFFKASAGLQQKISSGGSVFAGLFLSNQVYENKEVTKVGVEAKVKTNRATLSVEAGLKHTENY